ncbi:DUF4123 domain-containing protein [Massilia sp. DD77]|uniref:DUF4123 domain-containing protein n=1 Tax=Massilia sp. DD77 TaxID=3109349 RepID=UPI002FFF4E42
MLIDPFDPGWQSALAEQYRSLPQGARLVLLVDGAFVPGMFRELDDRCAAVLLFEALPGCSEATRDVSPFIVEFDPDNRSLEQVLKRCDGYPMVSAIATFESLVELGERLAAWCIVAVDGQRFNFRFPDTRRLPGIFKVLTPAQRAEFVGSAFGWRYMGRDGLWQELSLEICTSCVPVTTRAELNQKQFGQLVEDSEPDEMWVRLTRRGVVSALSPSQRHSILTRALELAAVGQLSNNSKMEWCAVCLTDDKTRDYEALPEMFAQWNHREMERL